MLSFNFNRTKVFRVRFDPGALQSHICPFLFLAYTPKQAQMPVMLRTTPNKRAIASPASTASTTGSSKSSEMRANRNCVETEVMMLESSLG